MNAPKPDELVEMLFSEVLQPPEGYEYYPNSVGEQLLYPVYGQDSWRILIREKGAAEYKPIPIFLNGEFIRKITKALHAVQQAMNQAISDDIPEPTAQPNELLQ